MPPSSAPAIDPESTQIHQGLKTAAISRDSLHEAAPIVPDPAVSMGDSIAPQAKPKSKAPILLGGVLVLLLVGAAAAFFLFKSKPTGGGTGDDPSPRPSAEANSVKADLVEIPGGTFMMGRNNGPRDLSEEPAHPVQVTSFFMDKTEVTNAAYAEFLRNTNHPWPTHWKSPEPPAGEELLPVSNVSVEDAEAFAKWRSQRDGVTYRLPTEEEWEYAARNGDRSDLYPWGKEWMENHAVLNEPAAAPVGSKPQGKNRWGVEDLVGNVWEWTSSKLTAYPGNPGEIPPNRQDWITFRGAGYTTDPSRRDSRVSSCVRSAGPPKFKRPVLGFRLVRSAQ